MFHIWYFIGKFSIIIAQIEQFLDFYQQGSTKQRWRHFYVLKQSLFSYWTPSFTPILRFLFGISLFQFFKWYRWVIHCIRCYFRLNSGNWQRNESSRNFQFVWLITTEKTKNLSVVRLYLIWRKIITTDFSLFFRLRFVTKSNRKVKSVV